MKVLNTLLLLSFLVLPALGLDGEEILSRIDRNQHWKTMTSHARMEITINSEKRVKTMSITGMAEGNRSLVTFTNPEDEGTRYLMRDQNLWIYFPEENDVIKISGHMLKDGMMGSDVSYEDALESDTLTEKYTVTITGDTLHDDIRCLILTLEAKVKNVSYHTRVLWVDTSRYIALREESYAKSGKLLKTAQVLRVEKIGSIYYPVKVEMRNLLRKNSSTVFSSTDIVFDKAVDPSMFTMRYLRR